MVLKVDPTIGVYTGRTADGAWQFRYVTDLSKDVFVEYLQRVTLTGAAQNIDLVLSQLYELKRISMTFDDTTTKTFTVDLYNNLYGTNIRIASESTNINQYIEYVDIKRIVLWSRFLRFAFTASTLNKVVDIAVLVEEIPVRLEDVHSIKR